MGSPPMPSRFFVGGIVPVMVRTRSPLGPLALGVALLVLAAAPGAGAQSAAPPAREAPPASTSLRVIAEQVARLFPVVQTDVIEVSGERVTLAAGRQQGVVPGIELIAYREGRELYHPTTKQLLGRTAETVGGGGLPPPSPKQPRGRAEGPVGSVVGTEVAARSSIATLATGAKGAPRPG